MKFANHFFHNITSYAIDISCILFLLFIGVMTYTSSWHKLYWSITIPNPPVLSNEDWQGSTIKSLRKKTSYNERQYEVWLSHSYAHENTTTFISINHITNWYRNSQDLITTLRKLESTLVRRNYDMYSFYQFEYDNEDFLAGFHEISFPTNVTIPSTLKCRDWDDNHHTCVYFGYYEHWFTQIWFMSEDKSVLTEGLMNSLIEKAVKIILEAPPPVP